MLAHNLRRWPNIKTTLAERFVFDGEMTTKTDSENYITIFPNKNLTLEFHSGLPASKQNDDAPCVPNARILLRNEKTKTFKSEY